jgi:hypothetical protein
LIAGSVKRTRCAGVARKLVKRFAAGQPLLTFLIAAAFASMILSRLGIQPFVILLWDPSSTGKSSAAVLVGSIFGGDPSRPQHSFVESFKVTEAGIEKLGLSHKDILLLLDEFSRMRGTPAQKVATLEGFTDDYAAGVGKTRGTDPFAGLQWSGAALITSNHSYAQLLAKANLPPAESMGPRLIEVPADMKTGMGIFTSLPDGCRNSTQASDEMRAAALLLFGLAAPEFAEQLIEAERQDPKGIAAKMAVWKQQFVDWAGPELTAVLGQLRDKFAAIYAAGMLAKASRRSPQVAENRSRCKVGLAGSDPSSAAGPDCGPREVHQEEPRQLRSYTSIEGRHRDHRGRDEWVSAQERQQARISLPEGGV